MNILKFDDEKYPRGIKNINKAPLKLYTKGNIDILNKQSITVVGSRNMSEYGRKITQKIVSGLVKYNIVIVSGMAIGIDTVAHKTCIENGGKTIAVLGSGLNKIFPIENKDLFNKIISTGGCVISEHEPNTIAQKRYFPMRNRIVSGLSIATLVIEATYRSGTSITADYAFKQGKKVFCIPNSIGNKNSAGIINLIKKGAKIVTSAEDILCELGIIEDNFEETNKTNRLEKIILENEMLMDLEAQTKQIYKCIKENAIINSEIMCDLLCLPMKEINIHLSILELKGLIVDNGNMNFSVSEKYEI